MMTLDCAYQRHASCDGFEVCACACHRPGYDPDPDRVTTAEAFRRYTQAITPAEQAAARAVFIRSLARWKPLP